MSTLSVKEMAGLVRRRNPEYFEQWTDDDIVRMSLKQNPALWQKLEPESFGEQAYRLRGHEASAGFFKRFGFQTQQLWEGTKAGMVGLFTPAEIGEGARRTAQALYENRVASDPELQAYLAWKEDEPGWSNIHTWERTASEVIPSLVGSMSGVAAALVLGKVTRGKSLKVLGKAVELAPMFAMEAGNEYNEVMSMMVDEMGLEPEEAKKYASVASVAYGVGASLLERVGARGFLKDIGLRKEAKKTLADKMTRAIVDSGVDKSTLARAGLRVFGTAPIRTLENAIREGGTETLQALLQQTTNRAIKLGYGDDNVTPFDAIYTAWKQAKADPHVWEEGFGGALMGVGGGVGEIGSFMGMGTRSTLQEIAAEERKSRKEKVEKVAVEKKPVTTVSPSPASEKEAFGEFVSAVMSPGEKMGDVIASVSEGEPLADTEIGKAIKNTEGITDPGKKILSVIRKKPELVDEILKSENSNEILQILHTALNEIKQEDMGSPLKNNKKDIVAYAKKFAERGTVQEAAPPGVGDITEYEDVKRAEDDLIFGMGEPSTAQEPDMAQEPQDTGEPNITYDEPTKEELESMELQGVSIKNEQPKKVEITGGKYKGKTGTFVTSLSKTDKIDIEGVGVKSIKKDFVGDVKEEVKEDTPPAPPEEQMDVQGVEPDVTDEQVEKDATVSLTKDITDMLKRGKAKISKGYENSLLKLQELQNNKDVDEIKTVGVTDKTLKVQAFDKDGKSIGGILSVPKVIGGKPTLQTIQKSEQPIQKSEPVKETSDKIPLMEGQQRKLKRGYKWFSISVKAHEAKTPRNVRVQGKEVELKGAPKNFSWFARKKDDGGWVISNAETGLLISNGKTMKEAIGLAENLLSEPDKIAKLESVVEEASKEVGPELDTAENELENLEMGYRAMDRTEENQANYEQERDEIIDSYLKADLAELDTTYRQIEQTEESVADLKRDKQETIDYYNELKNKYQYTEAATKDVGAAEGTEVVEQKPGETIEISGVASPEELGIEDQIDNAEMDEIDFQDESSSKEQLISDNKELADRILEKLHKFMPWVEVSTFEGLIEVEGIDRIGFAVEDLIAWSTTDGRMDTIPHEYAHIYIKMMKNENIVKRGIKIFKGEENLVKHMGLYFAGRMRDKSLLKKMKVWIKQFVNRIKKIIGLKINRADVGDFIAEEFYQGRWLGVEASVTSSFVEYQESESLETGTSPDEAHESTGGEVSEELSTIPSDLHQREFYSEILGIYVDKTEYSTMIDMAKSSKSYGQYRDKLFKWAKELTEKRQRAGDENLKSKEEMSDRDQRKLHNDWLKQKFRINRFIPGKEGRILGRQGADTRVYQRYELNRAGVVIDGITNKVQNIKNSETYTMNFVEAQFQDTEDRIFMLPLKQVMNIYRNRRTGKEFAKTANFELTPTKLEEIEKQYRMKYVNRLAFNLEDVSTAKELLQVLTTSNALSIIGTKIGNKAAIISTKANKYIKPANITIKSFEARLEKEIKAGNMTRKQANQIKEDANLESMKALHKSEGWEDVTLESFVQSRLDIGANIGDIIDDILNMKNLLYQRAYMSQALSRLDFWQKVRVPNFLIYENSASDSMTRLAIDMAEGIRPVGIGNGKLMIIGKDTEVRVAKRLDRNGVPVANSETEEAGVYNDYDGATFTGTAYFRKIANALGYKRLHQLKTFIRQRNVNDDGTVDYIGMKHMQFNAFKGMQFYKDGVLIAQVEGKGARTYFRDMNPESATYGQKFDMIASRNEAKMMYNGYDKEGELIDINENSIVVHSIQVKTKTTGAHPIALAEMLLPYSNDKSVAKLLKLIEGRYNEVLDYYTTKINSFWEDSSKFRDFVNTEVQEGRVPTELQNYFNMLSEDGRGIFHPALLAHILPIINNRLVVDGILKARAWGGKASSVYIKPRVHLKLEEGEVAVSGDNTVAVRQIEKEYFAQEGISPSEGRNYWRDNAPQNQSPFDYRLSTLNTWLETHEINILIHRNPIAKVTGPVARRIRSIVKGNHGQNIFLSKEDVQNILDGDWDGDKATFEFISHEHMVAMREWQNSDLHGIVDKIVSADIFGERTDKDKSLKGTSVMSTGDAYKTVSSNSKTEGATGIMVNAKTLMSQLFSKGFKMQTMGLRKTGGFVEIANPDDEVIMDYLSLSQPQLNSDRLGIIFNNGDTIVKKEGRKWVEVPIKSNANGTFSISKQDAKLYLKTTKGHEISTLFQLAVDSSKYRFWEQIVNESGVDNWNFMISRIFKRSDKKSLLGEQNEKLRKTLSRVLQEQNVSKIRAGTNLNTGKSADYDTNINNSARLHMRMYEPQTGELKDDASFSDWFTTEVKHKMSNKYDIPYIIKMKNKPTPVELLISGFSTMVGQTDFGRVYSNINAQRLAHQMAMKELVTRASQTPAYHDYVLGKRPDINNAVQKFLHEKRHYGGKNQKPVSFAEIWGGLQERMNNVSAVARSDFNKDMTGFVERFIYEWANLPEMAKTWATIEMLSGFESDVNILKLPPLALMDEKIMSRYLPLFESSLRSLSPKIKKKSAKDTRIEAEHIKIQQDIWGRYEKIEDGLVEKNGEC